MNAADPEPSLAVKLFGTEEPTVPPRILRAGALEAELDAGNLRHIRYGGVEVMRAISFIVRDRNWGTYNPAIADLAVEEAPDRFGVSYSATAADAAQSFRYRARITGTADGHVAFEAEGEGATNFVTNRTGFVVLHPIAGVAGEGVAIEHVDGRRVESRFPELIDPVQPMMNLRALTHAAAPGLTVECRMEGDAFEMEDQRNWTDASYKTYVRPLSLPWPYLLPKGEPVRQAVRLRVSGEAPRAAAAGGPVTLALGAPLGPAPRLGLGLDPDEVAATRDHGPTLRAIGASVLIGHFDPRRGHARDTLAAMVRTAGLLGAVFWLEAVVAEIEDFEAEVAELAAMLEHVGAPVPVVLLSPAADLKSTLPGSPWPPAPPADALIRAARRAFPKARIGGGMFSLFTELNRKRPPAELLDLVSFTTVATLHAGDDHSATEGLESLPAVAASARAIAGGTPFAVGPSAIGLRMNPYGEAPLENPGNIRQAMSRADPRQRGLLGAAWAVGYFARFAYGGAEAITLGGTTGPFGLLHTRAAWPQPWFDDHEGLFPMFHAVRGLAGLGGKTLRVIHVSAPEAVQAIAVDGADGVVVWAANLTPAPRALALPGPARTLFVLDAETFVAASRDPHVMERLERAGNGATEVTLSPYAIARLTL